VPGFAVKLALGEMGELALQSQRVMPNRAMKLGFEFKHADLDEALRESV
jgi:NAD dependent epimerase/dehydratase family enzyme